LKLRGSYGELGNNQTQDANGNATYFHQQLFETGYNEGDNTGVVLGGAVDPNLSWEKTASSNVGLDFGFFNNRITGSVDYYDKNLLIYYITNLLQVLLVILEYLLNVGALRNYGWEFALSTTNVQNSKFMWTTGVNLSFDKISC
jgi:hypothetical protein